MEAPSLMSWQSVIVLGIIIASAPPPQAPPPAAPPKPNRLPSLKDLPLFAGPSVDALAGSLRGHLVRNLPTPLYETTKNWGHTIPVANGVKWHGQGFGVHPEIMHARKNNGVWRKVRVTGENLADTLVLDIRNLALVDAGTMTFKVFLSFDTRVDYEQQNWRSGVRIYAGSAEAHLRIKLLLDFEATAALEAGKSILPDAVFRLHVTRADLSYDNLRVQHIAGIGGEGAKILGDALKGSLHEWRPSLEAELLAKADAAIVKAGDTKEIRVSLARLLSAEKARSKPSSAAPSPPSAGKR